MKALHKGLLTAAAIAFCTHAHSARADGDFPVAAPEDTNFVGLGVGLLPDYPGSDDYQFGLLPLARYEFGNHRNIELKGNYISANIIDHDVISFGPAVRYRFGRDDDIEDDVVASLGEIDDTVEAGATLSAKWILNNNIRHRFIVGADALFDVGDTYNGFNGSVYSRYWRPVSQKIDLGISGYLRYGSEDFSETYFGVTPAGATASGLPIFSADGGLTSFDITPMAMVHLSDTWHLGAGVRYSRLTGDAADSPVVDLRGDANQFLAAVGLIYTW